MASVVTACILFLSLRYCSHPRVFVVVLWVIVFVRAYTCVDIIPRVFPKLVFMSDLFQPQGRKCHSYSYCGAQPQKKPCYTKEPCVQIKLIFNSSLRPWRVVLISQFIDFALKKQNIILKYTHQSRHHDKEGTTLPSHCQAILIPNSTIFTP